jgi:hypothetical protein
MIVFKLESYTGEVNGFEARFGSGPHYWCEMAGTQRINCMIPQDSGYKILAKETITATIMDTHALYTNDTADQCSGGALVMFYEVIHPTSDMLAIEVAQVLGVAGGVGALVIGGFVGAAALDLQAIGVIFQSGCASAVDNRAGFPIKYFISPFYDTGVAGIVFGNLAFILVISGVHLTVSEIIQRKRGIARRDAWATTRFPSLSYGVIQLFYMGVCVGTFMGLGSKAAGDIVVGIIGVFFTIGIPSLVIFVIYRVPEATFIYYAQFMSKRAYHAWLFPVGYWTPAAVSQSYRRIFGNMNRNRKYFCIMPMVVSFLTTMIMFGMTSVVCEVRLGMTAGVFFTAAVVSALSRFGRSGCMTALSFVSYALLGVLTVLMAKSFSSPSDEVVVAKLAICILQLILVLAIIAYQLTVKIFEHKYWRKNRQTDLAAAEYDIENEAAKASTRRHMMDSEFSETEGGFDDDDNNVLKAAQSTTYRPPNIEKDSAVSINSVEMNSNSNNTTSNTATASAPAHPPLPARGGSSSSSASSFTTSTHDDSVVSDAALSVATEDIFGSSTSGPSGSSSSGSMFTNSIDERNSSTEDRGPLGRGSNSSFSSSSSSASSGGICF